MSCIRATLWSLLFFSTSAVAQPMPAAWHLDAISAPEAWHLLDRYQAAEPSHNPEVIVSVIDTGFALSLWNTSAQHADLHEGELFSGAIVAAGCKARAGSVNAHQAEIRHCSNVSGYGVSNDLPPMDSCLGQWIEDGQLISKDSSHHGTQTLGVIAARHNGLTSPDVKGLLDSGVRNFKFIPVRATKENCGLDRDDSAAAIRWAAAQGADVINISFHKQFDRSAVMAAAQDAFNQYGTIVVLSAGNQQEEISSSASESQLDKVVIVGGTQAFQGENLSLYHATTTDYSSSPGLQNYGTNFGAIVDIMAPAVNVLTTCRENGAASWDDRCEFHDTVNFGGEESAMHAYGGARGTSFSAPIVAGVIAQMKWLTPQLTPSELIQVLKLTARKDNLFELDAGGNPTQINFNFDTRFGAGNVDAHAALEYLAINHRDPVIATQPSAMSVEEGQQVIFQVEALGALTYQWHFRPVDGSEVPLVGEVGPSLTINSATVDDAGYYRISVANNHGVVVSQTTELQVEGFSCAQADLDSNGEVEAFDLATVLSHWNDPGPTDLDGSGVTNSADLAKVIACWGPI